MQRDRDEIGVKNSQLSAGRAVKKARLLSGERLVRNGFSWARVSHQPQTHPSVCPLSAVPLAAGCDSAQKPPQRPFILLTLAGTKVTAAMRVCLNFVRSLSSLSCAPAPTPPQPCPDPRGKARVSHTRRSSGGRLPPPPVRFFSAEDFPSVKTYFAFCFVYFGALVGGKRRAAPTSGRPRAWRSSATCGPGNGGGARPLGRGRARPESPQRGDTGCRDSWHGTRAAGQLTWNRLRGQLTWNRMRGQLTWNRHDSLAGAVRDRWEGWQARGIGTRRWVQALWTWSLDKGQKSWWEARVGRPGI